MWIESTVRVCDRPVGLRIERLDDQGREQTAAALAWLTMEAFSSLRADAMSAWNTYTAELLRDHVWFVIGDDQHPEQLESKWWDQAFARAFIEFVRHNDLAASVKRHLDFLRGMAQRPAAES
jgi:hypothetical protein